MIQANREPIYSRRCETEITKFHHIVVVLQPEELEVVGDIMQDPPAERPYEALRRRLCCQYAQSEEQKLKDVISGMQLGDRKPSRLLIEMRNKAGNKFSEEVLKSLFLQRLPNHVQQILAITNDNWSGADNVVADALSRINISTIEMPTAIDFRKMAEEQQTDPELREILSSDTTSLVLQPLPVGEPPVTLLCDVSHGPLTKFLGTSRQRTTPYHPAANGQVERFHRQLKAAIMAHGKVKWSLALPTILLGFRATWKEDLEATTAEMLYGAPIRLPGEFLSPAVDSPDPSTFVGKLREVMQRLLPPKPQLHGPQTVFVSKDLGSCKHVFLRTDALRKSLQPPYEGPFRVLHRTEKSFKIDKHGKGLTVNIDRVKPAYVLHDCDSTRHTASEFPAQQSTSAEIPERVTRPETVTRSGRRARFNRRYS
ncbi:Gag-Pol polyprotein like [Argiope bruennichi]|uniref:Gag-Pol polyprotein like n=1 Tax=Argiope bruennichi TaxID=94029 RepID=A0A8T0G4L6_ARGBR|nr:Gag-Pol polyprotein like [Argiope bruennichi]